MFKRSFLSWSAEGTPVCLWPQFVKNSGSLWPPGRPLIPTGVCKRTYGQEVRTAALTNLLFL